jgi:hypothetical protein
VSDENDAQDGVVTSLNNETDTIYPCSPNEDSNYSCRAANDDAKSKDLAQLSVKKRTKIAWQCESCSPARWRMMR